MGEGGSLFVTVMPIDPGAIPKRAKIEIKRMTRVMTPAVEG